MDNAIITMLVIGGAAYILQKRNGKIGLMSGDGEFIESGSQAYVGFLQENQNAYVGFLQDAVDFVTDGSMSAPVQETFNSVLSGLGSVVEATVPSITNAISSVFGDNESALLERIAKGEGTSDASARANGYQSGYDVTLGYGLYAEDKRNPISSMTFAELKTHQTKMLNNPKNKMGSSACGKYQNTRTNLFGNSKNGWYGVVKALGLSMSDRFSHANQERIGRHLLKIRGYDDYKAGRITAQQFQYNLALEWASIADPKLGHSHYGQHTGTTTAQIQAVLTG